MLLVFVFLKEMSCDTMTVHRGEAGLKAQHVFRSDWSQHTMAASVTSDERRPVHPVYNQSAELLLLFATPNLMAFLT